MEGNDENKKPVKRKPRRRRSKAANQPKSPPKTAIPVVSKANPKRRRRPRKKLVSLDERYVLAVEEFKKEFYLSEIKAEAVKPGSRGFIVFSESENKDEWTMTYSRGLFAGARIEGLKIVKEYGFFKDKDV
jgi:hypothetical protein